MPAARCLDAPLRAVLQQILRLPRSAIINLEHSLHASPITIHFSLRSSRDEAL